jgi:uncharacterized membrane protein
MSDFISIDLLFRWFHVLFGITWVGLLYYFNFVQTEYVKEASDEGKADVMAKLAPKALWWFRWGAMFTFITGFVLLGVAGARMNSFLVMGALAGTLMFINVWAIIWPKQKIMLGLVEGDKTTAGPRAAVASRTNTLLSAPMLLGMLGSMHGTSVGLTPVSQGMSTGLIITLVIILLIEANAIFGKMNGAMNKIVAVVHSSIVLSLIFLALIQFV